MPISLQFDVTYFYGGSSAGIEIPVLLTANRQSIELLAKVDTGAAHCIFERRYAEMLGITVESGRLQRFRTVAGSFDAHAHELLLQTLGIEFTSEVYFAHDVGFSRNFLGRSGWLDRMQLGLIDQNRTLCLGSGR